MTSQTFHFEDQGQDFLWFIVDETGTVQDAGPFQRSMWAGRKGRVIEQVDGSMRFVFDEGPLYSSERTINYPVEKVEAIQ